MTDTPLQEELEKRQRNLESVARHLTDGPAEPPSTEPTDPKPRRNWASLGTFGLLAAALLGKVKLLIPLLKFTKLSTLLTMFFAVWVYAQLWGYKFAIGFILLIYVHEMGHAIVLAQQGIPAGAPIFIPFVGAVISMRKLPPNAYVEALVGIGGPILGSVGALFCLLVGMWTDSLLWFALASTGFMLNLFNLIPISPLDGGRIVGVVSRWIWLLGYIIGIAVFLVTHSPILFLILLLGLFSLGRNLKEPRPGYFDVPAARRVSIGVAYFALLGLLALGMWFADLHLVEVTQAL
jgi:Zn-dependent protease